MRVLWVQPTHFSLVFVFVSVFKVGWSYLVLFLTAVVGLVLCFFFIFSSVLLYHLPCCFSRCFMALLCKAALKYDGWGTGLVNKLMGYECVSVN